MYTINQIADEINKLKPDFKEFKKLLNNQEFTKVKEDIDLTSNMSEKLFKAELVIMFYKTHNRLYYTGDSSFFYELVYKNVVGSGGITHKKNSWNDSYYYSIPIDYFIVDTLSLNTISAYVADIQNYLPAYLWNKIRTKAKQNFKELKPDLFALTTFKNYLAGLKKELPSTQAIEYLRQIRSFEPTIKQQYIEVLVDHLKQPSIAFQNYLAEFIPLVRKVNSNEKFVYINRGTIRNLANQYNLFVPYSVLDALDSSYKPFITNVPRKPTIEQNELSSLIGAILVLKTVAKLEQKDCYNDFAEHIVQHLKHPDYAKPLQEYVSTLQHTKTQIEEILNGFI